MLLFVLNVFFSESEFVCSLYNFVYLQMLIDRPHHQNMRERENAFSQISIFMLLVVNGARTETLK